MIDASTPLNVWSRSDEEIGRLMSHFAPTPFELDGVGFGSVEAFYTWLLCDEEKRRKVASMWGARARHACPKMVPDRFDYHGRLIVTASSEHHDLILRANRAKLAAHPKIAQAFVATLPRPIVHQLPDKDDPHEVFCAIMNAVRQELLPFDNATGHVSPAFPPAEDSAEKKLGGFVKMGVWIRRVDIRSRST